MKKVKYLALAASALLLITGCGEVGTSDTSSSEGSAPSSSAVEDSSSSSSTSGTTSSSSTVEAETFRVVIRTPSGITITSDKERAEAGETVTLTYTLSAGYSLVSITMNGTALEAANGTASFTMPDREAIISASLNVEGDVTLSGDVAVPFTLENGIYVAKDVRVTSESAVVIRVAGESDSYLGYMNLDYRKCFGNITYEYSDMHGITPILLGNNAVYDIYYDPSLPADGCVYIQRVGIINLPDSSSMMADLFDGSILSESPNFPTGVNHVEYYSSEEAADYRWDLYEGASLATITPRLTGNTRYVYKDITDGVYTVVDNYIENPYDTTRLDDSVAFSGRYKIVDEVGYRMSNFETTLDDAEFDVAHYSHDVHSLDFAIHYGYRTGFDNTYNDSLKLYGCDISSVWDDDEHTSFTITVSSYKTYGPGTYESDVEQEHITYAISATFTEAGAPKEGTYVEKHYDSTTYDFTNNRFLTGGEANPKSEINKSWSYGYGEAISGKPTFDTTPYFATSITASFVELGQEMTSFDPGTNLSDHLSVAVSPSTALDASQYVITASSDTSVVYQDSSLPDRWIVSTEANGTTTLTISHPSIDTGVSTTYELSATKIGIRSFYLFDGYVSDGHVTTSDSLWVYEGTTYTTNLGTSCGSAGDVGSLEGLTFSYSTDGYLDISVNAASRTITFDATPSVGKISGTSIAITVTVHSPYYDLEWWGSSFKESTWTITIYSNSGSLDGDSLVGTWVYEEAATTGDTSTLVFTDDDHTTSGYKTATYNLDGDVFTFGYQWDEANLQISHTNISHTSGSTYAGYDWYYLDILVDGDAIGICLYAETYDWDNYGSILTEIVGNIDEDEEGYFAPSAWVFYVKA